MKDWKRMMADEKGCPGVCFKLTEVYFLPPVVPSKFLCVGLNYRDHAKECRKEIPKVEKKKKRERRNRCQNQQNHNKIIEF